MPASVREIHEDEKTESSLLLKQMATAARKGGMEALSRELDALAAGGTPGAMAQAQDLIRRERREVARVYRMLLESSGLTE